MLSDDQPAVFDHPDLDLVVWNIDTGMVVGRVIGSDVAGVALATYGTTWSATSG